MMKKSLFLWIGGISLALIPESFAINAQEVVTYSTPPQSTTLDSENFDLFPNEKHIPDFPEVLEEDETDLNIWTDYYRSVATAYRSWAETKRKEARQAREQLIRLQNQMYWNAMRSTSYDRRGETSPVNQAKIQAIHYMKERFIPSHFEAESADQKAEFYETLADSCEEIKETSKN